MAWVVKYSSLHFVFKRLSKVLNDNLPLFPGFSSDLGGGGTLEEISTKMYRMMMSFVKIGAVNSTYLGA
jgi:hypothetical protein